MRDLFRKRGYALVTRLGYLKDCDYMQAHWAGSRFGPEVPEGAERAVIQL